ncbi:ATP-binding cassette domain-containing protein [Vibrio cholerae]|uniref:ATP-binding cassette domain-containing protein n=1 Tax=Vibrio cholerae TaxID=666 RepID=UPI000E0AF43F|nr:ATP-binding cassette domain-containing protein [Vibrio cholerae]EGQ8409478.1 ATP-binding cassette domain-containing protein [Vibrio cholerae]EGR2040081.1 ATP-binding cassette domain-containing protein [Vibrio cholerae]EGR2063606.1 ATP-binding cassette domain-containing protein [Vibrio cholerae]EGR2115060.1 ATP-binding cassette domain-containing protein [Vibrio cholerae]EGR2243305.1 ATP-binding cassette domain-containing protein [Vibrio cholerae]
MIFSLENLAIHKQDGRCLLAEFNLTIAEGEIVSLMGPSGCGKSTLLSVIAGHLATDFTFQGAMKLGDTQLNTLPAHQRQVGMLFQEDWLFPHLNVWENLAFALPNSIKGEQRKKNAYAALTKIALSELACSFPEQISGGQRARLSLMRMLLAEPKLVLLDEPFSKLDKALRNQFRDWVFNQLTSAGIPTLMVTHDHEDVPVGSRVIEWPVIEQETEVNHA